MSTILYVTFCSLLKTSSSDTSKGDIAKAIVIGACITAAAAILNHQYVQEHEVVVLSSTFFLGYCGIIFEESLTFNKGGVSLLMAASLWTILATCPETAGGVQMQLNEKLADVSQVIFFLMGAMTIVEVVDSHQGFRVVTESITTSKKKQLMWIIGGVTFFMSAILDNLTSTIVMVSMLRKLVPDEDDRKFFGAIVVIAANAGGAWTPIGDVTTTMLWIDGQISALTTMRDLFLPSLVSLLIPLGLYTVLTEDKDVRNTSQDATSVQVSNMQATTITITKDGSATSKANDIDVDSRGKLVFSVGVGALLFVPIFKQSTGLPPYLGMISGLGALWLLTDAIHYGEDNRGDLRVPAALSRIDAQGILFFLGILLSIASLDSAGLLKNLATFLDEQVPSKDVIAGIIGLASAVIDNVPLVAATMGMYDLNQYAPDDELWQLIAYCAGTGGSILIIGSAAGVAFMGMERVNFGWYTKKVAPIALAGYLGGILTYLGIHQLTNLLP